MVKQETFINKQNYKDIMKRGTLALLLICTLFFSFVLVQADEIEPIKQGEDALLYQTCNNCTYCNITSVKNEIGTTLLGNTPFDADGTFYSYNLLGGNTTTLGKYTYCYDCGNLVQSDTDCIYFNVTPSGRDGSSNIVFFVFVICLLYAINLFGFFGRNETMTLLGGMALIFLGVYMINNGVIIYRDSLTNYLAYITIAWGIVSSFLAAYSLYEDL